MAAAVVMAVEAAAAVEAPVEAPVEAVRRAAGRLGGRPGGQSAWCTALIVAWNSWSASAAPWAALGRGRVAANALQRGAYTSRF